MAVLRETVSFVSQRPNCESKLAVLRVVSHLKSIGDLKTEVWRSYHKRQAAVFG